MNHSAIRIERVTKRYGAVEVLRGVSLDVPAAGFTALMGKSGSGKSTLLGVVSGLEQPDEGRVLVQGADICTLPDKDAAELRRRAIGIVFQGFNLIPSLSAIENVLLPTTFDRSATATAWRQRGRELLEQVGLADRMHHRPAALSGGEQQRVAIARALINRPQILLADEPTGNLDEATGGAVLDLLLGISRDSGTTLLMVTHDRDIAARAQRIVEIKDGRIEHDPA